MRKPVSLAIFLLSLLLSVSAVAAPPEAEEKASKAEQLYNRGYLMSLLGYYEDAIKFFDESLAIQPTAEAYTYKGWTYSHMGDLKRAIEEAEKAIGIDPDFGNPYNDIGVYLIELGRDDDAIPYLEKAMRSKRYCCHQFPHFNAGRIYVKKKMYSRAREEFQKSLQIDPTYMPALQALEILKAAGVEES